MIPMEIDLLKDFEKISLKFPDIILKIKGFVIDENKKDFLEIIIYKGFSSSTTHKIEFNAEKSLINLSCFFNSYELFKAPLSEKNKNYIKKTKKCIDILNEKYWHDI